MLVLAIRFAGQIPVLIGFDENPGDKYNWPSGFSAPFIYYIRRLDLGIHTIFRCALLVDKDEQIADHMKLYNEFCFQIRLPGEKAEQLIDGLAWNLP